MNCYDVVVIGAGTARLAAARPPYAVAIAFRRSGHGVGVTVDLRTRAKLPASLPSRDGGAGR